MPPAIRAVLSTAILSLFASPLAAQDEDALRRHREEVMTSRFCARCHPLIYAEHSQNTHGRAFTDDEVRLATGRFSHGDCIRCHTPRPIFETGIGMNPMRRHFGLEEGNTCMTCHLKPGYDYSRFQGGSECLVAFDDRVGTVEACASCHRNHGTPYQWEKAPTGKLKGRACIDCHMREVNRPVAVGEEPRPVRSHVFPGSRSLRQLKRAYRYEASLEGNHVVVRITNRGAGHNFPTELKQRSVESLVVVTDAQGREVARSRMVFRDPYKRPYGLHLPVNTQIPAGETREHRVPIPVSTGTVTCELHFKLYYPIEDHHPDLARLLERRTIVFHDIEPSDEPIDSAPEVPVVTPEGVSPDVASPANLVDFARPPIGTVEVEIPQGSDDATIRRLVELFQFPVPEANRRAQARLVEIGEPAVPRLIDALGSWDNKTWKQAMKVLERIGEPALPYVLDALDDERLYVRIHARALLPRMGWLATDPDGVEALLAALSAPHALDRASAAQAIGALKLRLAADALLPLVDDPDPDVQRAAARALARLDERRAVEPIWRAAGRTRFPELRREFGRALAILRDPRGASLLLSQLDHPDDLLREAAFWDFFEVTGLFEGYDPLLPAPDRKAALARLADRWAREASPEALRRPPERRREAHDRAWLLVQMLGGGAGTVPAAEDDRAVVEELVALGEDAVGALLLGLRYPPGFAQKRARVLEALGWIGSREAAPAVQGALRDPVVQVAAWACWALERIGEPATLPAVRRYTARIESLAARGAIPPEAGPADRLLAQAARCRLVLGDRQARHDLVRFLLSDDLEARRLAIDTLEERFGERRGYDPEAPPLERLVQAARWM